MSYALSTTKRKFHRILDSISNSSSTSLPLNDSQASISITTLPGSHESPAKKPRFIRPLKKNTSSVLQTVSDPVSMLTSTQNRDRKKPHFTPWDRADFLERLKSFRHVDKWFSKPEKINEVQWAKRGWTCVGIERVRCVGCAREVVIRLESEAVRNEEQGDDSPDEDWKVAAHAELVEKYAEMIISEHDEGCLWQTRGCDTTIYRLPLAHQPTSLKNLLGRYESLVALESELPTALKTPPAFDIQSSCQQLLALLQSQALDPSPAAEVLLSHNHINEQALTLALFGWQADPDRSVGVATCNACFRRLGLWLFKSRFKPNQGMGEEEAIMSCLDVVDEHRDYCPWVNGASQHGDQKVSHDEPVPAESAGWEILIQALRNVYRVKSILSSPSEIDSLGNILDDAAAREAKDKERWVKFKRLKEIFQVKRVKGGGEVHENIRLRRPSSAT